ncbi:MAG: zinc-binding dehydrogenase, partial [Actinomycetota bacterium]
IAGASRIIVSDPVAERRDRARQFGATDVVDPTATDLVAAVHDCTGGIGVDYAFEAVGRAALVEACLAASRSGGTTVMVGVGGLDETLDLGVPAMFTLTERKLMGSLLGGCNGRRDIPRLLALWRAGRLDLDGMITDRRPLEGVNEAMADLTAGRGLRSVLEL